MTESTRPEPFFIAEQKALDLLNSVCAPWNATIEWIVNGEDLLRWLEQADLISREEAREFSKRFSAEGLDRTAKKVVELREYFRGFIKKHAGKPITKEALGSLGKVNEILGHDCTFSQITVNPEDQSLSMETVRNYKRAEDLLLPLAHEMMKCVCESDFSRIKKCENEVCTLMFLDTSKNGRRRWCTMSVCGNRAKAAAHRAKKKEEAFA